MNSMRILFASLILIGNVSNLLAWGQTGHRVVGEVAEKHLTRKARKNIEKLLGTESLAMVSTWMDEIKSDDSYDHTHDWHWVTIPNNKTYGETEKNPKGDLVEAIERMKSILKSDTAGRQTKVKALKYLVHLVGDIHQPLHVGNGEDRGGNDVKVKWFRSSSNLHRIWDSEIIDDKQLSYTELAESIDHATDEEIMMWQQGNPADWAHEAMQYRPQVYKTGDAENLSYEYMYHNWDLMQNQLEKAGIRLAGMLNEIFG